MEPKAPDNVHRRIISRIRALALKRHIRLSHVPDRAGVSQSNFWYLMSGTRSPTVSWLAKIADALEVDVGDLLSKDLPTSLQAKATRKKAVA